MVGCPKEVLAEAFNLRLRIVTNEELDLELGRELDQEVGPGPEVVPDTLPELRRYLPLSL